MSRKSAQRFCDNDMRENRDLKREERKIATRFRDARPAAVRGIGRTAVNVSAE
jgi:hypothetical protein